MKKALIFCSHRVPTAEPNAIRLINIALMLKQLGYETILYGVHNETEVVGEERGIPFVQWTQTTGRGIIPRQKRKKEFFHHVKEVLHNTPNVSLIISIPNIANIKGHHYMRKFSRKNGIVFIQSLVEWYGLAHIGGWKRFHRFLHNEYLMRFDNSRTKKTISISSYMAEYYKKKGCQAIVIPTMVDMNEYENVTHTPNERITVVYAGSPRRKDCIVNAILALDRLLPEERNRIQFHIYGASQQELSAVGLTKELVSRLGDSFVIHGRIPYVEVKQHVANAHYTILLRHNTVNANAGFSTKVGESMACGTPVIANMTSDLALYIKDKETGIVCENESVDACADAYRRILQISMEQYCIMRKKAKEMACVGFNLEMYVELLNKLIEE